jgi:hypothetical protein
MHPDFVASASLHCFGRASGVNARRLRMQEGIYPTGMTILLRDGVNGLGAGSGVNDSDVNRLFAVIRTEFSSRGRGGRPIAVTGRSCVELMVTHPRCGLSVFGYQSGD